jgi:hypothetical protein
MPAHIPTLPAESQPEHLAGVMSRGDSQPKAWTGSPGALAQSGGREAAPRRLPARAAVVSGRSGYGSRGGVA